LKLVQKSVNLIKNLEEAPLIRTVPDSGISNRSLKKKKEDSQLVLGDNSNGGGSERFSEISMTQTLQQVQEIIWCLSPLSL